MPQRHVVSRAAGKAQSIVQGVNEHARIMKRSAMGEGFPLTLVKVHRDEETGEGSFTLHKENLEKVIRLVPPRTPVAIISVVGAFRSGKSFLLSWFVRILEGTRTDDIGTLGGGNGTKNGFSWEGGIEPHTQGMMVWSQPFIVDVKNGGRGSKQMAVLLVDTQGTFDHQTDTQLEACLFGLSTTLSSCQIFNIPRQVQADNLGSLAVYLEYGVTAQGLRTENEHEEEGRAPFPRLEVLIRDWQNWARRDEPLTGNLKELRRGFGTYLDDILGRGTENTNQITNCFQDIGCFALPHPGFDVTSRSYDGNIADIESGFKRLVRYYIETVVITQLRETTLPNFEENQFVCAVERWVQLFNNGISDGQLPQARSWLGLMDDAYNANLIGNAVDAYERDVDQYTKKYVRQVDMVHLLARRKNEALCSFNPRGTADVKDKAIEDLRQLLSVEGERRRVFNRNRAGRWRIFVEAVEWGFTNVYNAVARPSPATTLTRYRRWFS